MRLEDIKKPFNKAIDPMLNLMVKLRMTPNLITTSALLFVGITVYFIIKQNMLMSGAFLLITAVIDAVDGALAKKVGSTKFGDFYDAFIDRAVEAIVYLTISYSFSELYMLSFFAFTFSFLTSYVAARAEVWTIGIKIKYLGIGSRSGRLTTLILAFFLNQLKIGLYVIIIIALITMVSRTITTFRILRKKR